MSVVIRTIGKKEVIEDALEICAVLEKRTAWMLNADKADMQPLQSYVDDVMAIVQSLNQHP